MAIEIYLGNIGSGKTASAVRSIIKTPYLPTYTNIKIKNCKHSKLINASMIAQKEILRFIKKRDGSQEPQYKFKINEEFWKKVPRPCNVIIDEVHSIMNARRSMSKINIIITDWLALIRRVLGGNDGSMGNLILISQLDNRIDNIARDMATKIKYHICHYKKKCKKCGAVYILNNEMPQQVDTCLNCGHWKLDKYNHQIEVLEFQNIRQYQAWKEFGYMSYYNRYYIKDIEDYFKYYDTLQWDNMFSEVY